MLVNRTGTVIVQDRGRVVGIVTDRDIALRSAARGRDPERTLVREIMSIDPAALPVTASIGEALELMQSRRIRRVLLFDRERLAGIVTLDDLIVSEAAGTHALALVVGLQLERPRRRSTTEPGTRPAQASHPLVRLVRNATGLADDARALTALEIVAGDLVRRLSLREASELWPRLPAVLRERLLQMEPRSERGSRRPSVEEELAERLHVDEARASEIAARISGMLESLIARSSTGHPSP